MRTDKRFRLKGVPTISWLEDNHVLKSLVEEDCKNKALLENLFDEWI